MNTFLYQHPAIDRFQASANALSGLGSSVMSVVRRVVNAPVWSRTAAALERWGDQRAESVMCQDWRVRKEIEAAALRAERDSELRG